MAKRILAAIFVSLAFHATALCATKVGTTIESQAFISYSGTTEGTLKTYTTVSQIYGLTFSPTYEEQFVAGGEKNYFPVMLANVGNGSARIYLSTGATPEGWRASLTADDNMDGIHQDTEMTPVPPSIILAEDAVYAFFLVLESPDSAFIGEEGYADAIASTEVQDGPAYVGGNGISYGGDDHIYCGGESIISSLGNARIRRDDVNKKIFLTWAGGPADIYYRTSFGATFEGGLTEATNVLSPWTSEAIDSQDGSVRFYRVAQTGTTSFAAGILGKYDVPVSVGLNELSLPLIPFDASISSVIGTQVTGANNSYDADRIWKYNPLSQSKYDIAWLVGGVGPPYNGQWYTGNSPTNLSIEADEGFILQIRSGHPAAYLTMVGKVSETGRDMNIASGMNFVGTCFPVQVPLGDQAGSGDSNIWESGATGATNSYDADRLWSYNPAVQANYDIAWLVDGVNPTYNGSWYTGNGPTSISLKPGKGYWIQVRSGHSPFTWHYPKPY